MELDGLGDEMEAPEVESWCHFSFSLLLFDYWCYFRLWNFILEVKFNRSFPGWLNPIISRFSLRKQSASKYVISMDTNKVAERLTKSKIYTRSQWFNS